MCVHVPNAYKSPEPSKDVRLQDRGLGHAVSFEPAGLLVL